MSEEGGKEKEKKEEETLPSTGSYADAGQYEEREVYDKLGGSGEPLTCPICHAKFYSYQALREHSGLAHSK